jgi:hypothetical protein
MRTTVVIDKGALDAAKDYSGIKSNSGVINAALDDYNRRQAMLRLLDFEGGMPDVGYTEPRRRRGDVE